MAMDKNITLEINGKSKPTQTNYDRIKSMSVEEMADLLYNEDTPCSSCKLYDECECTDDCKETIKQWLLQEVSDDDR